jgi:hypothetical protein
VVSARIFLKKTTTCNGREIRGSWGRKKKQNPQYYTPKKWESGIRTLKNYKTSKDPITRTITPWGSVQKVDVIVIVIVQDLAKGSGILVHHKFWIHSENTYKKNPVHKALRRAARTTIVARKQGDSNIWTGLHC